MHRWRRYDMYGNMRIMTLSRNPPRMVHAATSYSCNTRSSPNENNRGTNG